MSGGKKIVHFLIGGILLTTVGIVFLLANLGVIPSDVIRKLWPIFPLALGIALLITYFIH